MGRKNIHFFKMLTFSFLAWFALSCDSGGGSSGGDVPTSEGGGETPDPQIISLQFSSGNDEWVVTEGLTRQLFVLAIYSDNSTKDFNENVVFSSSDPDVLEIVASDESNNKGIIKAKIPERTARVTVSHATLPPIYKNIRIVAKQISSISITPRPENNGEKLVVSNTFDTDFVANALYNNHTSNILFDGVKWTSNDPSQRSLINPFTGKFGPYDSSSDNITIRAEYLGFSDEITAEIQPLELQSVVLKIYKTVVPDWEASADTLEIIAGETAHGVAFAVFNKNGEISTSDISNTVTWVLGNINYADIKSDGTLYDTDKSGGIENLTIDIEDISIGDDTFDPDPVYLTIHDKALTKIEFDQPPTDVVRGSQFQLNATGTYNDGSTIELASSAADWSSSDLNILTINPYTAFATANQDGSADVTVKINKDGNSSNCAAPEDCLLASTTINVHEQSLSSIKILPSGTRRDLDGSGIFEVDFNEPIPAGLSAYVTVIGYYEGGPVTEMDLSKDENITFTVTGGSIDLCSQVEQQNPHYQCWLSIADGNAMGTATARYDETDISDDIDITGTESAVLGFKLIEGVGPITRLVLQKDQTKTLQIEKTFSSGSQGITPIDGDEGITWQFSLDGTSFDASSDIIAVDPSSGQVNGVAIGSVLIKATIQGYPGEISQLLYVEVISSEIALDEAYIGSIAPYDYIQLDFDFSQSGAGKYNLTFIPQEKSLSNPLNPGKHWYSNADESIWCEMGFSKQRITIDALAEVFSFRFHNIDDVEGEESTRFSLVISKGDGYHCE